MQDKKDLTIKDLAKQCRTMDDISDKLKEIFKDTLQEVFEAEMNEHLGYEKHSSKGDKSGNSRNGCGTIDRNFQVFMGRGKKKLSKCRFSGISSSIT